MASATVPATTRPRFEVADVLRDHAGPLRLTTDQTRVVNDLVACRTSVLGGHLEECGNCGYQRHAYNSCANRHCPKCQGLKQELWAEAQEDVLLPTRYFQVVFTLPAELHPFFRRAPAVCLKLLFEAASEALAQVARDKRQLRLGFTAVLHTWTQTLDYHPHLHFLVPGGGLSLDGQRWVATSPRFFLPVRALQPVFRGKLLAGLEAALRAGEIPGHLASDLGRLRSTPKVWKVYCKRSLAGPEHVVRYLSRYVHRIAIANSRILDYDGQTVRFRYRDRQAKATRVRTVSGAAFCKLFLQHVLPPRFVRIRHYGLFATRCRKLLARCRELLGASPLQKRPKDASWVETCLRLFGTHPLSCPKCQSTMVVTRTLPPAQEGYTV
jgi:hypothetical protein